MRCGMLVFLGAWVLVVSAALAADDTPEADAGKWFEQHIRPLLAQHCVQCHGAKKQESGLRLDTLKGALEGGDSGPALVASEPGESLLIEAIKYESLEMPPDEQLDAQSITLLETWIARGAAWPEHVAAIRPAARQVSDEDRHWWAFQPLTDPPVPVLAEDRWSCNPIDHFVLDRLAQEQMQPAPRADEAVLVRRLYLDLIGLPPSPEQLNEYFVADPATRWEELVDQLLADPAYGEHWGRHWLDVVRYAESDGWNQDKFRPHIWRYRDYVVQSFNQDRPFTEFVHQQLAGDELAGDDPDDLAATGFLRLGIYEYNQRDARSHWNDIVNEMTDVVGDVFLGMGMSCARCHDHKFDPLLQTDYYQLRAFFEPVIWRDDVPYATADEQAVYEQELAAWQERSAEVQDQIDTLLEPYQDRKWKSTVDKFPLDIQACFHKPVAERTSWEHQMAYLVSRQFEEEGGGPLSGMSKADKEKYEALKKELAQFDAARPKSPPPLMTVDDFAGTKSPTVIPDDPRRQEIEPGFPQVLCNVVPSPLELPPARECGPRTQLARWIGSAANPLTTRVIVNRVWQQHFGRGLVATANDFGHLGHPPTHPELLDWLTSEFIRNGWSIKHLHRLIVTSATWRQSANHPQAAEYALRDPAGNLLWQARIRRLSAEQIRDAMLAVTGQLDRKVGGASVDSSSKRRSLYLKSFRNRPHDLLQTFDMANGLKSVAQREATTTPLQALLLMNGSFTLEQAQAFGKRLQQQFDDLDAALQYAFRASWGRPPAAEELAAARNFVQAGDQRALRQVDGDLLADFCHVLLNSNEFMYVD